VRRLALVFVAGAVWLFLLAIPALADNGPHVKGQNSAALLGSCASCHRAHSGQVKDLVKVAMPTLCYSCHGSGNAGATTDVQDGVAYAAASDVHGTGGSGVGALRGGGFNYALVNTATDITTTNHNVTINVLATGAATTSAHSVDGTPVTMWGAGTLGTAGTGKASVELTCASCHDPHGNGQYRILKPGPDDSYANDAAAGYVKINDPTTKTYTTTNYGLGGRHAEDVAESPLNADGSALNYDVTLKTFSGTWLEASTRWCATCHTRYFAPTGSAGNKAWTEAGRGDATYKFSHATRNIVDPSTNGAPAAGVINPVSTSSQLKAGATLGSYTDSRGLVFRGVAVSGTGSGLNSAAGAGDLLAGSAPRCITCHMSHGTNAAVGSYITDSGDLSLVTGAVLDSALLRLDGRGACQSCHAK